MRKRHLSLIIVLVLLGITYANGSEKPSWNSTADLTTGLGGGSSSFTTNELPHAHRNLHVALNRFVVTLYAPFEEDFAFESWMQVDNWGNGELNSPRLTLAAISWTPLDYDFDMRVGRFIAPFGYYRQTPFQFDKPFIAAPLIYGHFINISDRRGYSPTIGNDEDYGDEDSGVTPLGYDGLATGILFDIRIAHTQNQHAIVALTNAPPASARPLTTRLQPALTLRYTGETDNYWRFGTSLSFGSFMRVDDSISPYLRNPHQYRQFAFGADWSYTRRNFQWNGEFLYSRWNVPQWDDNTISFLPQSDPKNPHTLTPSLYGGFTDVRITLPQNWLYSTLALRLETLRFLKTDDQATGTSIDWDNSLTRWSVAWGAPLTRSLRLKTAFSNQFYTNEPKDGKDWTLRMMLSVIL